MQTLDSNFLILGSFLMRILRIKDNWLKMKGFKTILIACIISLSGLFQLTAQTQMGDDVLENDQESKMIIEALDSLTYLLYNSTTRQSSEEEISNKKLNENIPVFPDSVYAYRLSILPSPIKLEYNDVVRKYIDMYLVHKRGQVEKMLGLAELYFPVFEEILDKYDMPLEFKYLPIIESALNPHAVSRVGATGLWQFMYTTAKMYNLQINSYIDERRDPNMATDAAARYLKDLYTLYNDWSLALAAYNCGPGNVNKAIRRSGGKSTYWEIRDYLPRETSGYVPAFIAATYALHYYEEHGLSVKREDIYQMPVDTVMIMRETSIKSLSKYLGLDEETISFLNPSIKKNIIPYSLEPYCLKLPLDKIGLFIDLKDSIYSPEQVPVLPSNSAPEFASAKSYSKTSTSTSNASVGSSSKTTSSKTYNNDYMPDTRNKTKLVYTVKSGDNLGYISSWYDCSVSDLKAWNHIRGTRINVGQKLTVYVPNGQTSKYKNIDNLSFEQKKTIESQKSGSTNSSSALPANNSNSATNAKYIHYTIKSGDNLWDLSKKYPKNSVDDLKRINNITDMSVIKPGFVIKIAI